MFFFFIVGAVVDAGGKEQEGQRPGVTLEGGVATLSTRDPREGAVGQGGDAPGRSFPISGKK